MAAQGKRNRQVVQKRLQQAAFTHTVQSMVMSHTALNDSLSCSTFKLMRAVTLLLCLPCMACCRSPAYSSHRSSMVVYCLSAVLQFKIEPFKHPVKMDPKYGGKGCHLLACTMPMQQSHYDKHTAFMLPRTWRYAEKTWKVLEDAIHEINNHNASGLSFEELYR